MPKLQVLMFIPLLLFYRTDKRASTMEVGVD